MVDQHALSRRLSALEGYIGELSAFTRYSRQEFVREPHIYHLAERLLHLACETVLDAGQLVIAQMGFRQSESYKDVIAVLCEEGILEEQLAERLKVWVGFRNVLVHLYLDIDHGKSYEAIQEHLPDLQAFAARMARFLTD